MNKWLRYVFVLHVQSGDNETTIATILTSLRYYTFILYLPPHRRLSVIAVAMTQSYSLYETYSS